MYSWRIRNFKRKGKILINPNWIKDVKKLLQVTDTNLIEISTTKGKGDSQQICINNKRKK